MADHEPQSSIVTIDGPAGAGKSTVARQLAERLEADFLDTGAMYRGVAATVLDRHADPADQALVADLVGKLDIKFDWNTNPPALHIDGVNITDRLRDADITSAASLVAANGKVRAALVEAQRRIGNVHPNMVTEGRDQGSVVFPKAGVKFYLDATPDVRAHRRTLQWREAGKEVNQKEVLEQIHARDHRDSTRADGPLIQPDDSIVVDSSDMTLQEVIDMMFDRVQQIRKSTGGAA